MDCVRLRNSGLVLEGQGVLTPLAFEELVEDIRKARRVAHAVKQGHARFEFEVIGRPEHVPSGFVTMLEKKLGAFQKPRAEDRMREVIRGILDGVQCEPLGHRAPSEALDLREDEPHPMGRLPARFQFCANAVIAGLLSQDEVVEHVLHVGIYRARLNLKCRPCVVCLSVLSP